MYLFILAMNDSGSTFLQNTLSKCANCISFHHPKKRPNCIEGQAVLYYKNKKKAYPRDIDNNCTKVWSEKKELWQSEKSLNWQQIKEAWEQTWKENPKYKKVKPENRVFIEKTPYAIYCTDMYLKHFEDPKFIILHRNPYAVSEGIRRTIKKHKKKDYSIEQCIKHWILCSYEQMNNIDKLKDKCVWFTYEHMTTKQHEIENIVKNFVPQLHDFSLSVGAMAHSIDGSKSRPAINLNDRQIKNLSQQDIEKMNTELVKHKELMGFFGFEVI